MSAYPTGDVTPGWIAFSAGDPVSDFELWLLPLTGDPTPRRLSDAIGVQAKPATSPDSRWITYDSNESGQYEVYIRSASAGTGAHGGFRAGLPVRLEVLDINLVELIECPAICPVIRITRE